LDYEPYYDKRPVNNWKIANKFCKIAEDTRKSKQLGFDVTKLLTAPENSVGSIVHNNLVKENQLEQRYEYIHPSDKIKLIHIIPNEISPFKSFCFKDAKVVDDVGLRPYVDFEKFWEKEVIDKVDIIAEKINWKLNLENTAELDVW